MDEEVSFQKYYDQTIGRTEPRNLVGLEYCEPFSSTTRQYVLGEAFIGPIAAYRHCVIEKLIDKNKHHRKGRAGTEIPYLIGFHLATWLFDR